MFILYKCHICCMSICVSVCRLCMCECFSCFFFKFGLNLNFHIFAILFCKKKCIMVPRLFPPRFCFLYRFHSKMQLCLNNNWLSLSLQLSSLLHIIAILCVCGVRVCMYGLVTFNLIRPITLAFRALVFYTSFVKCLSGCC